MKKLISKYLSLAGTVVDDIAKLLLDCNTREKYEELYLIFQSFVGLLGVVDRLRYSEFVDTYDWSRWKRLSDYASLVSQDLRNKKLHLKVLGSANFESLFDD